MVNKISSRFLLHLFDYTWATGERDVLLLYVQSIVRHFFPIGVAVFL